MKIEATIKVEYEVDPKDYVFSGDIDEVKRILRSEHRLFTKMINDNILPPDAVTVVKVEEVK